MFFRRKRIPPDNYPDDFDTPAYRAYRPNLKPGVWLWLWDMLPRVLLGMLLLGAIGAGFVGALFILPPVEPQIVVITGQPSATPLGDIQGDFPPDVQQKSITLPARIDSALGVGERHGYRFFLNSGLTWVITVIPDEQLQPIVTLYNPDGTVADISDFADGSQIIFQAAAHGQYGVAVESPTSGGYTLSILPSQ
jgi:hypothetical protein